LSAAEAGESETQSVAFAGPPLIVNGIAAPGFTAVNATLTAGPAVVGALTGGGGGAGAGVDVPTVIVALVASLVNPSLAKKRMLYVPGVDGAVKCNVAPFIPLDGAALEPLKYSHTR
jgi:hypothetical protein